MTSAVFKKKIDRGYVAFGICTLLGIRPQICLMNCAIRYTWEKVSYPNYHGHTLLFEDGDSICRCCSVKVAFELWAQHIHGKGLAGGASLHLKNLKVPDNQRPLRVFLCQFLC